MNSVAIRICTLAVLVSASTSYAQTHYEHDDVTLQRPTEIVTPDADIRQLLPEQHATADYGWFRTNHRQQLRLPHLDFGARNHSGTGSHCQLAPRDARAKRDHARALDLSVLLCLSP